MSLVTLNKTDLHEKAMYENAVAQAAQSRALLDYVMMMTGIDLPYGNDEEEEEEE